MHSIDQSECNIFGQNLSIFNPNWFKHQSFFDWYVYKPVDLLYKWIGSTPNSKPVVYMGLSQVKILQTCCFRVTNQNASFRQAKKIHYFLIFCLTIFKHMFVHSAQTQGAMLELKSRKKNSSIFLDFHKRNRPNGSCKVGFDIPPLQTLNLPPLAWDVDL